MVKFLYNATYETSDKFVDQSKCTQIQSYLATNFLFEFKMVQELDAAQTSAARVWLHHLKVAKIADTYDINSLERVAIVSFHKLARPRCNDDVYVEVALQCSKSRFPRSVEKAMARQACQHMATLKDNEAFTSCMFLKHMGDFLFISCADAFQKEHDLSEKLFKDMKNVLAPGRCIKASCRASFPQDLKVNRGPGAGRQNYKFQCRACNTLNPLPELEAEPEPEPVPEPEPMPGPENGLQHERGEAGDGNGNGTSAGDVQDTPEIQGEALERRQQEQEVRQDDAATPGANQFADNYSRSRGLATGSSEGDTDQRAPVEERSGSQTERRDRGDDSRSRSQHYRSRHTTRITHRITTPRTPSTPRSTPRPSTPRPNPPRSILRSTPRSEPRSEPRTTPMTTPMTIPTSAAPNVGRQRRVASKMYESRGRDGTKKIVVGLKRKDLDRSETNGRPGGSGSHESSEIQEDIGDNELPVGPLDPGTDESRGRSNRQAKGVRFADELEQLMNSDDRHRRREKREETARRSDRKARRRKSRKSSFMQRFFAGIGK